MGEMQVGLHVVGHCRALNERSSQCSHLSQWHSLIKQNDLITPENRLYDDGSAAASSITYINSPTQNKGINSRYRYWPIQDI